MADPVSLAITLALSAANMALTMSRPIEGAKLDDTRIMSADYGAALLRVWGRRRITPQMFFAEDLTHVEQERKTKGGKLNSHTYFATFAVALAVKLSTSTAAIAGVRRIWFDDHLVYDMSGAGPVTPFDFAAAEPAGAKGGSGAGAGGYAISDHMAVYLGTMDQEPDPRMQATIDARTGIENSCPAYHGIAYIVFKDLPVEKFGNRIPLVSVEVVAPGATSVVARASDLITGPNAAFNMVFSPYFSTLMWASNAIYETWDVAAQTRMVSGGFPEMFPGASIGTSELGGIVYVPESSSEVFSTDGTVYADVYATALAHMSSGAAGTLGHQQMGVTTGYTSDGRMFYGSHPWSFYQLWVFEIARNITLDNDKEPDYQGANLANTGWQPCCYFADLEGGVLIAGREVAAGSTTDKVYFMQMPDTFGKYYTSGGIWVTMPGAIGPAGNGDGVCAMVNPDGDILFIWGDELYIYGWTTGSGLTGPTATVSNAASSLVKSVWNSVRPGTSTIWLGATEYDTRTGAAIRTVSGIDTNFYKSIYDPVSHALVLNTRTSIDGGGRDELTWYHLDRVGDDGVTLADVVSDVCAESGVDAAQIDVTALTQPINGYSVSTGSGKDWIGPLLDLYDVDPRPHGFVLEFLRRGGAAGVTISSEGFALSGDGGEAPLFTSPADAATDMLAMATLQFADADKDQAPGNAKSPALFDAGSKRTLSMNLGGLALTATEARQLVTRYVRRTRFDAKRHVFALPASSVALEPGDVHSLDLRGVTVTARCVSLVAGADRRIDTEWKRDDPSVAVLDDAEGAGSDGQSEDVITVPGLTKGFVLDIPLIRDVDNTANPVIYLAAAPYSVINWTGATILQAVGGTYSEQTAAISPSSRATWGYTTDQMPETLVSVWDRGSSVNVALQVGTLSGCTEGDIDANPQRNLCRIGQELVNFTTATLEGDGSYTLSGFLRGRRGTEWAIGTHATGEEFLLLDSAVTAEMGLSEVSTIVSFKAVTAGRSDVGVPAIGMVFHGASLKPYAPAHVYAVKSGSDWIIHGTRRTRVGGAWTDGGGTVPLSEASELYEIDLSDGVTQVTKTTTSLPYTWTAAAQATDMGGVVADGDLHGELFQMSDAVGRGWGTSFLTGISYTNPGGRGNRTALISVTNVGLTGGGTAVTLVDGAQGDVLWHSGATGDGSDWWLFDFITAKTITEFTWYQSNTTSHGTWRFEGSHDNSAWTQCGSDFTLAGSTGGDAFSTPNTVAYRYYRLRHMSGTRSSSPYLREIEFRIG